MTIKDQIKRIVYISRDVDILENVKKEVKGLVKERTQNTRVNSIRLSESIEACFENEINELLIDLVPAVKRDNSYYDIHVHTKDSYSISYVRIVEGEIASEEVVAIFTQYSLAVLYMNWMNGQLAGKIYSEENQWALLLGEIAKR